VSLVLLGLSLPALAHAYRASIARFAGDRLSSRLTLVACALAALGRWVLAPKQIVTMYIGYLLTEQAIELSTASHYGLGSLSLYHALFGVLPLDHASLLWTNAVLGVLTLPLAAAFAARLTKSPRTGALFALLVALTPLFVRNDTSDANHVPCLFWAFGGLVSLGAWLDDGRRSGLVASAILLALAANGRPEMPLVVAMWIAVALVATPPPRARWRDPALWVALPLASASVVPHLLHVGAATAMLEERGGLPGAGSAASTASAMLRSLVRLDTLLTPSLYPAALLLLALAAVGLPVRLGGVSLRLRLALALTTAATIALYGMDLCRANMARVHVPGALLCTLLAAISLTALLERAAARSRGALSFAIAIAAALFTATAAPSAAKLFAETNEQTEESLIREAVARLLRDAEYTFVRFARADRDLSSKGSDSTHQHFPDYLLRPPQGRALVSSFRDWIDQPSFDRPAFVFVGLRCYAEFRDEGTKPPHGAALQPACAELRERFELEPVFERDVRNYGDVWLEYYGDAPTFRVGLYRVRALRAR
jgi:hypothetical protein